MLNDADGDKAVDRGALEQRERESDMMDGDRLSGKGNSQQPELDEFGLPIRTVHQPVETPESSDVEYDSALEEEPDAPADQPNSPRPGCPFTNETKDGGRHADGAEISDATASGDMASSGQELPTHSNQQLEQSRDAQVEDGQTTATEDTEISDATASGGMPNSGQELSPHFNQQLERSRDAPAEDSQTTATEDAVSNVAAKRRSSQRPLSEQMVLPEHLGAPIQMGGVSEWSHQLVVPQSDNVNQASQEEDEWQEMPAYASHDVYDDDGKLIAHEAQEIDEDAVTHAALGGAAKGYTRVNMDDDAQSASSMDENTKYLFKEKGTHIVDEDEEARDPLAQLQATKDLLTDEQRIAYVAVARVAMVGMTKELEGIETTKGTKKDFRAALESLKMWGQKMMVRLYAHMEINSDEQVMIEQLAEHGVEPGDLTPTLMKSARIKNPMADTEKPPGSAISSPLRSPSTSSVDEKAFHKSLWPDESDEGSPPPPYEMHNVDDFSNVRSPSEIPTTENLDIDLRWTVLCDLFLVLIADSVYDSRSRSLLERVGSYMGVPWLDICKFERRVTDALEMQEEAIRENWNEDEHMENRRKMAIKRRMLMMGLATVGGSLVIGLSAGLLAPVIGAGLAAGFTTIGVAGTSGFLAGAGGAAVITTTGVVTGGAIAVRASGRRMGSVKTFEYRPLHNNKSVNLIVTVSGWMNGKIDDVRLPYSTVDPVMGDVYSVLWEPEMLQSMGQTINILATEALTQGLQQVLGSTVLVALMASLQLPIVLTKLSYLIDNPWTVSLDRATSAGLILADSLIDRNLGVRPVTLVGFSLGSRVIFSCLKELASKGAFGLVQNVYLFGSPVVAKRDEYLRMRSVVSGRFVNGYATNDWILGYLFRATSGGIMRVAGLAPVDNVPGLENIDVTELVNGHMAYRSAMPRLLREVGWSVESEEFAEIEDPDPDNHQQRQREIIAEIDEARKELEREPEKKSFGLFGRNKNLAKKKEWEMYDDTQRGTESHPRPGLDGQDNNVLFDIDAIRAELASEQIEVREIESTLPPMKLNIGLTTNGVDKPSVSPYDNLRGTKSCEGDLAVRERDETSLSSPSLAYHGLGSPGLSRRAEIGRVSFQSSDDRLEVTSSPTEQSRKPVQDVVQTTAPFRPDIRHTYSMPVDITKFEHNAWLDDDPDYGKEQEITLTFE